MMAKHLAKTILIGLLCGTGNLVWADVIVVASKDSPIRELTSTQLTDIYLGRLTRLPDGTSIQPLDQAEENSTHEAFYQQHLGRTPAQIRSHWSRLIFTGRGQPPRSVKSDAAMAEVLIRNPNAIGYMETDALPEGLRVIDIEP